MTKRQKIASIYCKRGELQEALDKFHQLKLELVEGYLKGSRLPSPLAKRLKELI